MGSKLNRHAYEGLIEEDVARVMKEMPDSLEREHVIQVLRHSVECYYPTSAEGPGTQAGQPGAGPDTPPTYVHAGVSARRAKIEAFRSLGANWDSYGCEALSQKSVDAALAMEPLLPAGFVSVVPISGGGVMFGTKGEAVTVEIYADDDADIAALISLGD